MASISESLRIGFAHHQAGRRQAAEEIYRQILAEDPNQADANHLLGILALEAKQHEIAIDFIKRAIRSKASAPAFHNNLGEAYRGAGKLTEAVASDNRALKLQRDFAEAHSNLGNALLEQGKPDEAIEHFRRAVRLKPRYAEAHNNLGNAFTEQGKFKEAVASYQRALEAKPDYAKAHFNLGNALKGEEKLEEAIACFRRAIELAPNLVEAHINLANTLRQQGRLDEATAACRRTLELAPERAEAHQNLGNVLVEQGRIDEAVGCFRRALELKPDLAAAYSNLGNALARQKHLDEAVGCLERALALRPDFAEALNNLGNALRQQAKLDEAIAAYRRALELKPDYPEADTGLGAALLQEGQFDLALASFDRALERKPEYPQAHLNRSMVLLVQGKWQEGWPDYEYRQKIEGAAASRYACPRWNGEPLAGRSIVLCAEQGLGDTIQFARYAALIQERGAKIFLECPKALLPLLQSCPFIDRLLTAADQPAEVDFQVPLLSLPRLLETAVHTIPAPAACVHADAALVEDWRKRLGGLDGFKIGIHWQGNRDFASDRFRSFPLSSFAPLAAIGGVQLVSLQKGEGAAQLADAGFSVLDLAAELDVTTGPFMDTAAVMMNLDLVISCDTSVAHVAGALGVDVWLALSKVPDWRWLLDRDDTPWYPTMRLFRQSRLEDWAGVFQCMGAALSERLRGRLVGS
jgi:tetratricopeptide (TPR) repeat protein